jgi:hypothetical protein
MILSDSCWKPNLMPQERFLCAFEKLYVRLFLVTPHPSGDRLETVQNNSNVPISLYKANRYSIN